MDDYALTFRGISKQKVKAILSSDSLFGTKRYSIDGSASHVLTIMPPRKQLLDPVRQTISLLAMLLLVELCCCCEVLC